MSEKDGDLSFTFDTSEFKNGVKEIVNSMGKINDNTKGMTEKIGKGMGGALSGFALKAVAVIGAIKGAMSALAHGIPEIGQTISIAGQIITKNLLWPLRKELLPMLNKILGWVRDHRKEFIILGGVIANAFKMIKGIFMAIAKAVSPIVNVIKDLFTSIFGNTAQSFADTMNLIMFKITAFVMIVSSIVKPVFEGLAEVIKMVIGWIEALGEGFSKGFSKMFSVKGGVSMLVLLKDTLVQMAAAGRVLIPIFEKLGEVIGVLLGGAINSAVDSLKVLMGLMSGKNVMGDIKGFGKHQLDAYKGLYETFAPPKTEQVQDAIVTKSGRVLKTSPEDTIIATKTPGKLGGGHGPISISFGDFHVTTTEGNAVRAGQNVIHGVEQQIKNILLNTLVSEGAR